MNMFWLKTEESLLEKCSQSMLLCCCTRTADFSHTAIELVPL